MKIVIINGSPRNNGATAKILNRLSLNLQQYPDVKIKNINISDLNLNYCTGCSYCYKKGYCHMNDDLEKLSMEISNSDGVIIGSPTYVSNISGQMKTLIDRGHFVIEQLLYDKYSMSVVTYENYGGHRASKILSDLLSYSGSFISGKLIIKNPLNKNPLDDKKNLTIIDTKAKRFYDDINNRKVYFFQKLKHYIVLHYGIKPFVNKNKDKYQGVLDNHWKKRKII